MPGWSQCWDPGLRRVARLRDLGRTGLPVCVRLRGRLCSTVHHHPAWRSASGISEPPRQCLGREADPAPAGMAEEWFICTQVLTYPLLLFRKKACKYFEQGRGTCPFGSKCLYRHAYPDGRLAEPEKPRKQLSSEGTVRVRTLPTYGYHWGHSWPLPGRWPQGCQWSLRDSAFALRLAVTKHICWLSLQFLNSVRLWDFIENRESRHAPSTDDVDVTELGDLFMHLSGVEPSET